MRDEHALPKATARTLGRLDGALRLVTKGLVFVLVGGLARAVSPDTLDAVPVESGLDVGSLASTFRAMNKDQKEGLGQNIKGRVKEAAGVLTGDRDKESDGAAERAKGAAKKAVGDVKHAIAKKLDK